MPTKPNTESYARMAAEAEEAVAAVKDPELRRVAFEKILTTLLEGKSGGAGASRSKSKVKQAKSGSVGGTPQSTSKAKKGPKARIEELINEGFFKKQQTIAQVKAELANRGYHIALTSLSGPLQRLTRAKCLRRQKVKANKKGSKTTYAYSNW